MPKNNCWTCRKAITPAWWNRHIVTIGHVRRAHGDPPPFVQPQTKGKPADEDEPEEDFTSITSSNDGDAGDPDTRAQCDGCSRGITPGREYYRDDGNAYHNNCVPLTTTRPLNRPQAAQVDPRQAGKLVAGVCVQLGAGRPQNG